MKSIGYLTFTLLVIVLFAACGGSGGGETSQGNNNNPFEQSITSKFNDRTYFFEVHLPTDYESSGKNYPVIYASDRQTFFSTSVDILKQEAKEVIFVSITTTVRFTDFSMPGAESFYNFITLELIPFIDAQYRVDETNRVLSGHSLGGLFVVLAMLLEDPDNRYFHSFIAQDGTFNFNESEILSMEQALYDDSKQNLPVNFIVSTAGSTNIGNYGPGVWLYNLLNNRSYQNLNLHFQEYDAGHLGQFIPSFRDALNILYP